MEPILPDFHWQPYLRISDLPEAQLIYAIILSAWEDANKRIDCPVRRQARHWFQTNKFKEFCSYLDLPYHAIYQNCTAYWSKNDRRRA